MSVTAAAVWRGLLRAMDQASAKTYRGRTML